MGTWAFGCDLCMEACPINHRLAPAAIAPQEASTAGGPVPYPDLVECLELSQAEFEQRFRGTAVWRCPPTPPSPWETLAMLRPSPPCNGPLPVTPTQLCASRRPGR